MRIFKRTEILSYVFWCWFPMKFPALWSLFFWNFRSMCMDKFLRAQVDTLLEEIIEVEANLEELKKEERFVELDVGKKWAVIFQNKNIYHLKKLVSALLSIFPSNAYCESLFSKMNALWTDETIDSLLRQSTLLFVSSAILKCLVVMLMNTSWIRESCWKRRKL